ncbi:4Fe-4S binding protein [Vibrio quintilis]|uniref:4-hydroxyphenylacetate decarboxylase activating enzyme n=1 Tax=Vibrio quintilis TaxID=1117707 RepID=A0A1M7YZP6_9VIBR|nr:4Fe-4S binding protein [Vibrio quintilis]SHO58022.1 4-hydroxyphenylacetate decarboxylase activating enzyme [Vibrio quintilis]
MSSLTKIDVKFPLANRDVENKRREIILPDVRARQLSSEAMGEQPGTEMFPVDKTCTRDKVILEALRYESDEIISYFDLSFQSVYDGPGVRVVVFMQGCHADCVWCHSPHARPASSPVLFFEQHCTSCHRCEAACPGYVHKFENNRHILNRDNCIQCGKCIEVCPGSSIYKPVSTLSLPTTQMPVGLLFQNISPHLNMIKRFGGITLSGGEALLQKKAVIQLLSLCKAAGIHTAIETSGLLPAKLYRDLDELVDCWLYGMRFTTNYPHNDHSKLIERSVEVIAQYHTDILYRIPVVPGHTDTDWYLDKCLTLLTQYHSDRIFLSPWNVHTSHYYQASGIREKITMPDEAQCRKSEQKIRAFFRHHHIEIADISAY